MKYQMSTIKQENRPGPYQFQHPLSPNPRNPPPLTPSHNLNNNQRLSFQYLSELHPNQIKTRRQTIDYNPQTLSNRPPTTPNIKPYTFSLLAEEKKRQEQPQEGFKFDRQQSLTPKYQFYLTKKNTLNEKARKSSNQSEGKLQSVAKIELVRDRSDGQIETTSQKDKQLFCSKLKEMTRQNQMLVSRVQDFKKLISQKDRLITKLSGQLVESSETLKVKDENLRILTIKMNEMKTKLDVNEKSVQTHRNKCQYVSNCFSMFLTPEKESSSSKLVQIPQLKLVQLLSLDSWNIQAAIQKIMVLKHSVDESKSSSLKLSNAQKQIVKLIHHLKKKDAQFSNLLIGNAFLSHELSKNIHLIQQYNRQITTLQLKQLQHSMQKGQFQQ